VIARYRARPARSTCVLHNVLKTFAQIVVFWTFFLAVLPAVIHILEVRYHAPRFPSLPWSAVLLFAVMGSIGLYCGMIFAIRGGGRRCPSTPPPASS
jgi:hypothetical protein